MWDLYEIYTWLPICNHLYRKRQWHPTPVPLPGKAHGWRSLVGCSPWGRKSQTRLSEFPFTFHFHAVEKEMATHSSVLAWSIPGTTEPGGLPSLGSHRVGHDWSDLAAAAAAAITYMRKRTRKRRDKCLCVTESSSQTLETNTAWEINPTPMENTCGRRRKWKHTLTHTGASRTRPRWAGLS